MASKMDVFRGVSCPDSAGSVSETNHEKCLHMAQVIFRYKDMLAERMTKINIMKKSKSKLKRPGMDESREHLFLMVRRLECGRPETFEKFLEITERSMPDIGKILRVEWDSEKSKKTNFQHISSVLNEFKPDILKSLRIKEVMDELKTIPTLSDAFTAEFKKAPDVSTFLSLIDEELSKKRLLLCSVFLNILSKADPRTADHISRSVRQGNIVSSASINDNGTEHLVGEDYQQYVKSLRKHRTLIEAELSIPDLDKVRKVHDIVLELESSSVTGLLDRLIHQLQLNSSELYEQFLFALQRHRVRVFAEVQERYKYGYWVIRENLPELVARLEIGGVLDFFRIHFEQFDWEDVSARRNRGERVDRLLDIVLNRLQCKDTSFFDGLMTALAGLDTRMFHQLAGRHPTLAEARCCIQSDIDSLRQKIEEIGHKTDKIMDRPIDLDKNYVRLRLVQTVNAPSSTHLDNEHPSAYQSSLTKSDVDIEDVLGDEANVGRFILIQGRCGIGKTTMIQHLGRRWAKKHCLKQFYFIFLLPIRRLMVMRSLLSFHDMLTKYSLYPNRLPTNWLKNWPQQILLNMDGLDEFPDLSEKLLNVREIRDIKEKATPEELCLNILKRNLYPEATLVCLTRSFEALSELKPQADLEVMGLTTEGVHEFIERNVTPENQIKVKSNLAKSPVLMSVCSITFYASVLCRVIAANKVMSDEDIQTYSRLTAFLIRSYPLRQDSKSSKQMQCSASFKALAEIALHAEVSDKENGLTKISIDLDDVSPEYADSISVAERNGLVHITRVEMDDGSKNILEFPHLSIQEFFAALQFLKRDDRTQEEWIDTLLKGGALNMLQLFLFGAAFDTTPRTALMYIKKCVISKEGDLDDKKQVLLESFEALLSGRMSTKTLLKGSQIAYETQSDMLADIMTEALSAGHSLKIECTPLNALDIKALTFVVRRSAMHEISLFDVNLDNYSVGILMEGLKGREELRSLDLSNNQISEEGLRYISDMLKTNPGIEELLLDGNHITSSSFQSLIPGLETKRQMLALSLRDNSIGDQGAEALTAALQNTDDITGLNVSHNSIGPMGMSALQRLSNRQMRSVTHLRYDGNSAGDQFVQALFSTSNHPSKLVQLSLNETLVTSAGAAVIAENLPMLASIEYIGLKNCQVGTHGAQMLLQGCRLCNKKVELDLMNNQIHVTKLHTHNVNCRVFGNVLGSKRVQHIASMVSNGKRVFDVLDLSYCGINDADIPLLTKTFMNSKSLVEISLIGNRIGERSVRHLACLTFSCPELRKINLARTYINTGNKKMFFDMSLRYKRKSLDLSGYYLDETGMKCLSDTIKSRRSSLKSLRARSCGFSDIHSQLIGEALKENQRLISLDLAGNKMSPTIFNLKDAGPNHRSSLRDVDLSSNELSDTGAEAISAALSKGLALSQINLTSNKIGAAGGKAIGAALARNSSLTQIVLHDNHIGDEGGKAIAEALAENTTLSKVDLSRNAIGDAGGKALGLALSRNASLTEINLHENYITDLCVKDIAAALSKNTSLTRIDLGCNTIGDEGGKAIAAALKENRTLRKIDLQKNGIGILGGEAISEALKVNSTLTHVNLYQNKIDKYSEKAMRQIHSDRVFL